MKNVKQLTTKQSISLQQELFLFKQMKSYWKGVSESKEKSIKGLMQRMIDLEDDLKYELRLNSILQKELQKTL